MGRKDLLTKLGDEIKIENSYRDHWLINYAFTSFKPSPNFFAKINELTQSINQTRRHAKKSRNVFITNDLHGAIIATKLAKHYGAEVSLYKAEEIDPVKSSSLNFERVIDPRTKSAVVKSICSQLKKHSQDIPSSDVDVLGNILFSQKYIATPKLPIEKAVLEEILKDCSNFQVNKNLVQASYGITLDDVIPIARAIETYLDENKENCTEDVENLYNTLSQIDSEDNDWVEGPSETEIDDLLKKRISARLSKQIKNQIIANEIIYPSKDDYTRSIST